MSHSITRTIGILMAVATVGVGPVAAQSHEETEAPKHEVKPMEADITQLSWMSGAWSGEALGGRVEEDWSSSDGGSMMGMFRLINKDNQLQVCEFLLIEQEGPHVVYRFRHYNPGHKPWEKDDAPLVFDLVRLSPNEAVFESSVQKSPMRLTYRRSGDELSVVVQSEKDGVVGPGFTVPMRRAAFGADGTLNGSNR